MISDPSAITPADQPHRISVLNRQGKIKVRRKAVAWFCTGLFRSLKIRHRGLSVAFVGSREIRLMNRRYRGKDYATDVLSFSYGGVRIEGVPFLGEIIIAPVIAVRHAIRYGISPEREIRKLLVHGVLHLLGYDHETDEGQMSQIQAKIIRRRFFVDSPSMIRRQTTR